MSRTKGRATVGLLAWLWMSLCSCAASKPVDEPTASKPLYVPVAKPATTTPSAAPQTAADSATSAAASTEAEPSKNVAYLTVGHGERVERADSPNRRTVNMLLEVLERQTYRTQTLRLAGRTMSAEVPRDAAMVLVLGPSKPFSPAAIDGLRRYAERGGRLLLALDPDEEVDLDPLARIVGVRWRPGLVIHDKIRVMRKRTPSDKSILVANSFAAHGSIAELSRLSAKGAAILLPGAAALERRAGSSPDLEVVFTVKSRAQSYRDLDGNFAFDAGQESRSVHNLVAAIERAPRKGQAHRVSTDADGAQRAVQPSAMRAIVVGDVDSLSDFVFALSQTNLFFVLETIRWLEGTTASPP